MIDIAHAAAETVQHAAESTQGIASLGIDWKAFVFQLINFALLLLILRKFAYGPILGVIDARRQKITESLENAQAAHKAKAAAEQEKAAVIAQARQEAQHVLEASHKQAQTILADAQAQAEKKSEKLLSDASKEIQRQLEETKQGLRKDMLRLVAQATEKVIDVRLDSTHDEKLVIDALKAIETGEKA